MTVDEFFRIFKNCSLCQSPINISNIQNPAISCSCANFWAIIDFNDSTLIAEIILHINQSDDRLLTFSYYPNESHKLVMYYENSSCESESLNVSDDKETILSLLKIPQNLLKFILLI